MKHNIKTRMEVSVKREQILPTVLIIIDISAAFGYFPSGNWRMIIYWISAACLTFCVTY